LIPPIPGIEFQAQAYRSGTMIAIDSADGYDDFGQIDQMLGDNRGPVVIHNEKSGPFIEGINSGAPEIMVSGDIFGMAFVVVI
jgi:hypothetical protein